MASDKQAKYIMSLLGKAGYSTRYMNAQFKELGASMRERSGSVESWVRGMTGADASKLIDRLKDAGTEKTRAEAGRIRERQAEEGRKATEAAKTARDKASSRTAAQLTALQRMQRGVFGALAAGRISGPGAGSNYAKSGRGT